MRIILSISVLFYLLTILFSFIVSLVFGDIAFAVLLFVYLLPSFVTNYLLLIVAYLLKMSFKYWYPAIFLASYLMLIYIYTLFSGDSFWVTLINLHSNNVYLLLLLPVLLSGMFTYIYYFRCNLRDK